MAKYKEEMIPVIERKKQWFSIFKELSLEKL
jgi:hypothetical protein